MQAVVGDEIWLDPTEEEGKISSGTLILSGMPALGTITSVWQSGKMTSVEAMKVQWIHSVTEVSAQSASQCMDACQERYTDIHAVIAQSLMENASNT